MTTPKIKTTVYSHKVIDVVDFDTSDNVFDWEVEELMHALYYKITRSMEEGGGRIHIKVDRPLSKDEAGHRAGVVAKNIEKRKHRTGLWAEASLRNERAEYERLKAKFEGTG